MNSTFISRWPVDLAAVNVDGSIIDFLEDGSVTFSNEMLSPGAIISSWYSKPQHLFGRSNAMLPILKPAVTYHLTVNMLADRDRSTQIQLIFYDANDQEISRENLDETGNFVYPQESHNFQINLVNIRHRWIHFSDLQINEVTDNAFESMIFGDHWGIMPGRLVQQLGSDDLVEVVVSFDQGQSSYSFPDDEKDIYVITDGQNLENLVENLYKVSATKRLQLKAGKNFYYLTEDAISNLRSKLKQGGA